MNESITLILPPSCPCIRVKDQQGNDHGEIVVGEVVTAKDWEAELGASRAARAAIRWFDSALANWERESRPEGDGSTDQARRLAWAAGLEEGLKGEHLQIDSLPNSPRLPPAWPNKGARAHANGWRLGDAIRRAVKIANGEPPVESIKEEATLHE